MSIYGYIKDDHSDLELLLDRIEAEGAEESDPRTDLFNEFRTKMLLHSKAEESSFYKALRDHRKTGDHALHNTEEHQEIEDLMHELIQPDLTGPQWFSKFTTLKKLVKAHIRDEETRLFAEAKEILSEHDAKNLEQEMKRQKRHERMTRDIRLREDVWQPDYIPATRSKGNQPHTRNRGG